MGKIGDLFVRLGLKKEGFSQGMQEAKKETKDLGETFNKIKVTALAVWAAIGAGVMKVAKDVIASSNLMGDAWEQKMAQIKGSWHSVMAELTAKSAKEPGFWMRFFNRNGDTAYQVGANAKAAGEAAAKMTEAFDAQFELAHSVRLQRLAVQQELNELYIAMRDTTLSPSDRMAAAEKYRALLEPIAKAEVEVYGNMLKVATEGWQAGVDLDRVYSTDEMVEFFTKIGTHTDEMKEKYSELYRVFNDRKGDVQNQVIFDVIAQFQQASNQMSDVDRQISRITNSIKATMIRSLEDLKKAVATYGNEEVELDLKLDLDLDKEDLADLEAFIEQTTAQIAGGFKDKLGAEYAEIENMNRMLAQSMTDSFSGGLQAITDFLMGVDGAGTEQIMAAFIQPIANMMKGMGEMFMAEGIAELELISGTPTQKIAAGAALIAISSAIASGLSKMSSALGGTSASTSAAGTSTAASSQKFEQEITVNVVGEISGDKIILAGQKTLNKWSR